jgi:hypothetical protein
MLIFWVVAITIFFVWYLLECLFGKTGEPHVVLDERGNSSLNYTGAHQACPISVIHFIGRWVYRGAILFIVILVTGAMFRMSGVPMLQDFIDNLGASESVVHRNNAEQQAFQNYQWQQELNKQDAALQQNLSRITVLPAK